MINMEHSKLIKSNLLEFARIYAKLEKIENTGIEKNLIKLNI